MLVSEDEAEVARLFCALLERGGFITFHAPNGLMARRFMQDQVFDVVILDVDMPSLGGIEVCQSIRSEPRLAHLPVVLCSGRLDLAELAKNIGADDFIKKPSGLLQLADRITLLLGTFGLRPKPSSNR